MIRGLTPLPVSLDGAQDPRHVREARQQAGGGLRADARHPGQPVGGVAAQDRQVGVLLRTDPVRRDHGRLVEDLHPADPAPRVEHPDARGIVDELDEVAVTGDHLHGLTPRSVPSGQGGDHVVGLEVRRPDAGDAQGGQDLGDDADLDPEGLGLVLGPVGGHTVRLVGRQQVDPPRGRQSSSQQATSPVGDREATRAAHMSRNPRTALTGVPSGAVMDSGTPWKAR